MTAAAQQQPSLVIKIRAERIRVYRWSVYLQVKARKIAWNAVFQRPIGNFYENFERFSEHGIFHGINV